MVETATYVGTAYKTNQAGNAVPAGQATVMAQGCLPWIATESGKKRMRGGALVNVDLPTPGSLLRGFTAIFLQEGVKRGGKWSWHYAGLSWDYDDVTQPGDVAQVYGSPGYKGGTFVYPTWLLPLWNGVPFGYSAQHKTDWEPLYLNVGWTGFAEGRRYRSQIVLCDVEDVPKDSANGVSLLYPQDFSNA